MGILQARVLEWVAMPFFRESSWLRDWTHSHELHAGRFFTIWDTREEMQKKYCYELWKTVLTLFSCRIFTVSGLIFRSLKHFLSLFLYMVWGNVLISFFYIFGGDLFTKSCPILVIPWTIAHQVPLSMRFSRQEYWSGLSLPSPGDLPNPRIEPGSPHCRQILYWLSYLLAACIACIYPLLTAWLIEETVFLPLYVLISILTN